MKKKFRLFLCAFALFVVADASFAQTLKAVDNTQNAGKVEWLQRQADTGKVPFGVPVSREFAVKNISREDLIILQVRSNCHCTVAEWSSEPIRPGHTGVIKVTFDAQREGDFYKVVMVSTNFDSAQTVPLALTGKVEKKQEIVNN